MGTAPSSETVEDKFIDDYFNYIFKHKIYSKIPIICQYHHLFLFISKDGNENFYHEDKQLFISTEHYPQIQLKDSFYKLCLAYNFKFEKNERCSSNYSINRINVDCRKFNILLKEKAQTILNKLKAQNVTLFEMQLLQEIDELRVMIECNNSKISPTQSYEENMIFIDEGTRLQTKLNEIANQKNVIETKNTKKRIEILEYFIAILAIPSEEHLKNNTE